MQIVINIQDDVYKRALVYKEVQLASNRANDLSELITAVANGTPLPKGHGRLIDADALGFICTYDTYGCDKICSCDNCGYNVVKHREINDSPTIIEPDREVNNESK